MRTPTRLLTLTASAALAVTLSSCATTTGSTSTRSSAAATSSSPSASPTASVDAQHNAADVTFTREMIVHHQGAVKMAGLAATRASNAQVKDLAERIEAAQGPEITEMTSWLTAWEAPRTSSSDTMGMMGDDQMDQLTATSGPAFDAMFLELMTIHHQGAIAMAEAEQSGGSNTQAIALATSIKAAQTAEVDEMTQLLATLGS